MREHQILGHLQRREPRLVRGFSELGVRVTNDTDWFAVNNQACRFLA